MQTSTQTSMQKMPNNRIYYGYWLIVAAFVAQFVSAGVQNYVIGPFMIPMTEEMGWSRAQFTLPRTLGQMVMALTGFFIGSYVDKVGAARGNMLSETTTARFS